MNKADLLKQIAEELESVSIYDEYVSQVGALDSDKIRLGVLGQANAGKTTFVNALLGTDISTSNLPSGISYFISYCKENSEKKDKAGVRQMLQLNNQWLEKNNVDVLEINKDIVIDEITAVDLCKVLSGCDACVYLLNAQAALNRTDMFVLKNLNEVNIPTMLVFSRAELLSGDEYTQVADFIKNNLKEYSKIEIFDSNKALITKDVAEDIQASTAKLLSKVDIAASRACFDNFFLGYALSQLYGKCQEQINTCREKQENAEKQAEDKLCKLNDKATDWLKVETQLRQRTSDISGKLRVLLDDRKSDMLRRLAHDVDVCGDVKMFWEKDFPFRLEEMMKIEIQSATQMVNQELVKTMQWLQDDLLKQFRCRISLSTGVAGDSMSGPVSSSSNVEIADTNKLKIVTRIGTAATVIAAGALFATSGIGGIIMAVSMVSGLGAEFFMRKQTNDSKEQIKRNLPEIVSRAQLQVVTDFDQKIQDVTNELISHLQTLKIEWNENSVKSIEQEKAIAKFNFSSAKWDNVMSRINQLSEIILK